MESESINQNNYEAYILDHIEGKLGPVGTAELLLFFEQHPHLKENLFDIGAIYLKPESGVTYGFCEALRQPADADAVNLNQENCNHYFIASNEGDLSPKGIAAVENFILQYPEHKNDFGLFKAARLQPDPAIQYPAKNKLKKPAVAGLRRLLYYAAAAATIFIMISVYMRLEPVSDNALVNTIGGIEKAGKTAQPASNSKQANVVTEPNQKSATIKRAIPLTRKKTSNFKKNATPEKSVRDNSRINNIQPRQILNITSQVFDNQQRSFYSDLYEDIRLSQEIMLAGLEPNLTQSDNQMESMAKFKTNKRMGGLVRGGAQIASQIPENLNGWMLADLGISGLNLLTNSELKLQRRINADGKVDNIRLTERGQGYLLRLRRN